VLFIVCRSLNYSQTKQYHIKQILQKYIVESGPRPFCRRALYWISAWVFSTTLDLMPMCWNAYAKLRKTDSILIITITIIVNIYSKNHSFLFMLTCDVLRIIKFSSQSCMYSTYNIRGWVKTFVEFGEVFLLIEKLFLFLQNDM